MKKMRAKGSIAGGFPMGEKQQACFSFPDALFTFNV